MDGTWLAGVDGAQVGQARLAGTQRKIRESQYCNALRASILALGPGSRFRSRKSARFTCPGHEPAYAAFFFAEMRCVAP